MFIVFLGPPGVGKGTQARRLVNHLGLPHVSTGEMLRAAMARENEVTREMAESMESGRLVSDDLVLRLVADRLARDDCRPGCLFDGFPRTLVQAKSLDRLLAERYRPLAAVLQLQGEEQELVARMLRRAEIENRADDTAETVRRRMEIYRKQTAPLVKYYQEQSLLEVIDAMGTPDEVFQRVLDALDRRRPAAE